MTAKMAGVAAQEDVAGKLGNIDRHGLKVVQRSPEPGQIPLVSQDGYVKRRG
jgi:hypothetical protein